MERGIRTVISIGVERSADASVCVCVCVTVCAWNSMFQ